MIAKSLKPGDLFTLDGVEREEDRHVWECIGRTANDLGVEMRRADDVLRRRHPVNIALTTPVTLAGDDRTLSVIPRVPSGASAEVIERCIGLPAARKAQDDWREQGVATLIRDERGRTVI